MAYNVNGYIYIAYLPEYIYSQENIYKIGKTNDIIARIRSYPEKTVFLFISYTDNIDFTETNIKEQLKRKFTLRSDIGSEYFEGEYVLIRNVVQNKIDLINHNVKIKSIIHRKEIEFKQRQANLKEITDFFKSDVFKDREKHIYEWLKEKLVPLNITTNFKLQAAVWTLEDEIIKLQAINMIKNELVRLKSINKDNIQELFMTQMEKILNIIEQ